MVVEDVAAFPNNKKKMFVIQHNLQVIILGYTTLFVLLMLDVQYIIYNAIIIVILKLGLCGYFKKYAPFGNVVIASIFLSILSECV